MVRFELKKKINKNDTWNTHEQAHGGTWKQPHAENIHGFFFSNNFTGVFLVIDFTGFFLVMTLYDTFDMI